MKNVVTKTEESRVEISYKDLKSRLLYIKGVAKTDVWRLFNSIGYKVLKGTGSELSLATLPFGIYLLEVKGELHRIIK